MTSPGGSWNDGKPSDAIEGDDLTSLQGLNESTYIDKKKQQTMDNWMPGHINLGEMLTQVFNDITDAAIHGVQVVVDGLTGIFKALVEAAGNFLTGLADALAGNPPNGEAGEGPLADISDGQRDLIGQVNQLGDNAGFCNLVMSHTWRVLGHPQKWLGADFDTYITQHKNCHKEMVQVNNNGLPGKGIPINGFSGLRCHGIVFDAPGVWQLNSLLTASTENTAWNYVEHSIFVYKAEPERHNGNLEGRIAYSETRNASGIDGGTSYSTSQVTKSILIPDDGETYFVIAAVRAWRNIEWYSYGGAIRCQFTANRFSTDTTDFGTHDDAKGTVNV